jgi:enoyl-CoA hydratase
MRFASVNYEQRGTTALITLDEPGKLNALSPGIREGLVAAFAEANHDDQVRVVVLTGAGDKAFCAGADISGFEFSTRYARDFMDRVLDVLRLPETIGKPVIAAVNGYAYATLCWPRNRRALRYPRSTSACCRALPSYAWRNWSDASRRSISA